MRLRNFLLLSIVIHLAALSYPIVFIYQSAAELPPVVVNFTDESTKPLTGDGQAEGRKVVTAAENSKLSGLRAVQRKPIRVERVTPLGEPAMSNSRERQQIPPIGDSSNISLTSAETSTGIEVSTILSTVTGEALSLPTANGSSGEGVSDGRGNSGIGSGSGLGRARSAEEAQFVQVGYKFNPKPEYPERARKEGKEGQVLLRVLVDEEGKSKIVEVNQSSGSEALDKAATEAIKRWRFSPARDGEKRVQSWVRIPIDFRLRDASN